MNPSVLATSALLLLPALALQSPPQPGSPTGKSDVGPGEAPTCAQVFVEDQYGPGPALWSSGGPVPRLRLPKVVLGPDDSLVGVVVTFSGSASGSLGFENTTPNQCVAFPSWSMSLGVQPAAPIPGLGLVPFESSQLDTVVLDPADGLVDYGGDSGSTVELPPGLAFLREFSLSEDLEVFVDSAPTDGDAEYVEFDHFAVGNGTVRSTCGAETSWTSEATLRVQIAYTVCTESTTPPCPTETVLQAPVDKGPGPMDARELALLHDVRDQLLASTPAGRLLIARFYAHAFEAHVLFMNHPELRTRAADLLRKILPRLQDALRQKPSRLDAEEERSIAALIRDLEPHVSPAMLKTLEELRRDLRDGSLYEVAGLRR